MGDAEDKNYKYKGRRVVRALVKEVTEQIEDGATVVFGGYSAGGRGAMMHLDWVNSYISSQKKDTKVVGHIDSAVYLDV